LPGTNAEQRKTRLPRQVLLLSWVSFFQDISGEMVTPVMPLFVVGVLGASATVMGWVDGAAAVMVALMTAWAGWRSDGNAGNGAVPRRVPWIRWGYGLPIVGKVLLTAAVVWPMVMGARVVDRAGKGLRSSTRDALITDAVAPEMRGRAFGFHRGMDAAGSVVGVMLVTALLWWLVGSPAEHDATPFRIIFGVSATLGLMAWGLTLFLREAAPQPVQASDRASPLETHVQGARANTNGHRRSPGWLGLPSGYWRTLALMLIFALSASGEAFLLLRVRALGHEAWVVAVAYGVIMLTQTMFSFAAGAWSDRAGRWRVVALGWALSGIVLGGMALVPGEWVWPLLALYGVSLALTDGVGKAIVADQAPRASRGKAMGVYSMSIGLATLLASVGAGVMWDWKGHEAAFGVGAAIAGGAVVLVPLLRPRSVASD
jgi:MFS family permease